MTEPNLNPNELKLIKELLLSFSKPSKHNCINDDLNRGFIRGWAAANRRLMQVIGKFSGESK